MRTIPLANGRGFALVDDEDYERLSAFKWYRCDVKDRSYAATSVRDDSKKGKQRKVFLHRMILGLTRNGHSKEVDHVDLDGLNCQRSNLRVASSTQNKWNRPINRANSSGFKGVSRHRSSTSPWQAGIKVFGKSISLGVFRTPEEAHAAYCAAAREHFGEFARTS